VAFGCWCVVDSLLVIRSAVSDGVLLFLAHFILVRAVIFMCYYDVMLLATRYALGHHIIIHEVSDSSLSSAQTFSDTMKQTRKKANSLNTASLHIAQSRKQISCSSKEFAIPH